jgi:hypothetical protein
MKTEQEQHDHTDAMHEFKFKISINEISLDDKLPSGDSRWAVFNDSFVNVERTLMEFCNDVYTGHAYTSWHEGRRKAENFILGQHIALDFDTQDLRSCIDTLAMNKACQRFLCAIHTTPTHTPEGPKARIVWPLNEPIHTADGYKIAVKALQSQFTCADPAPSNAVSFFYGNKSATVDDIWFSDGSVMTLDVLRKLVKAQRDAVRPGPSTDQRPEVTVNSANIEKTLATIIDKATQGNRNKLAFWIAKRMVESDMQPSEQEEIMRRFAGSMASDFTEGEALKALYSARKNT